MTRLIAIEGIDGIGKSTQSRILVDLLECAGKRAKLTGLRCLKGFDEELNSAEGWLTKQAEVTFFASQWRRYLKDLLIPQMSLGNQLDFLIADRYLDSFLAYQTYQGDVDAIREHDEICSRAPVPCTTIVLIGRPGIFDATQSAKRLLAPNERALNDTARQEHALKVFSSLASRPAHHMVDAHQARPAVAEDIWRHLCDIKVLN